MCEEGGKRGSSGEATAGSRETGVDKKMIEEAVEEDGEKRGELDVNRRWYVSMQAPTVNVVGMWDN